MSAKDKENWSVYQPLMAVHEMGKYISGMNNKKSSGPDEISSQLLKLASQYIAGSCTDLCFLICASSRMHRSLRISKSKKLFLYPKLDITKIWMTINQSLSGVRDVTLVTHICPHSDECLFATLCNQTWYFGAQPWAWMSCEKMGFYLQGQGHSVSL